MQGTLSDPLLTPPPKTGPVLPNSDSRSDIYGSPLLGLDGSLVSEAPQPATKFTQKNDDNSTASAAGSSVGGLAVEFDDKEKNRISAILQHAENHNARAKKLVGTEIKSANEYFWRSFAHWAPRYFILFPTPYYWLRSIKQHYTDATSEFFKPAGLNGVTAPLFILGLALLTAGGDLLLRTKRLTKFGNKLPSMAIFGPGFTLTNDQAFWFIINTTVFISGFQWIGEKYPDSSLTKATVQQPINYLLLFYVSKWFAQLSYPQKIANGCFNSLKKIPKIFAGKAPSLTTDSWEEEFDPHNRVSKPLPGMDV